jgi:hypothetical protein
MEKAVELATALNTAWVHTIKATALRCRTSSNENELALLVPTSTSRVLEMFTPPPRSALPVLMTVPTITPFGHPSPINPHTALAPPISTAGTLHPKPPLQELTRHTNTVTGTDTISPTSAKIACVCNAIPPETQLVSPPLSLLTHLKAATVFNLRTGLPKDLLLLPTITAMDGSRILWRTPPMGSRPSPSPRVIPTCRRSSPCTLSPLLLVLAHRTLSRAP